MCLKVGIKADLLPFQGFYHAIEVLPHEGGYRGQRVRTRHGIKIQRAPNKMARGICEKKLIGGSCRAFHIKHHTMHPIGWPVYGLFINVGSLHGMFISQFKSVGHEFIKIGAGLDGVIAAINFGIKAGHHYVKPALIAWFFIKIGRVLLDFGVNRLVEGEITVAFFKGLVGFFGVHYPRVSAWFGDRGVIVAAQE